MKPYNVCALLPMKAHSERVPNKNVRDFNGLPLYAWILQALDQSTYVREILVDTDSDDILRDLHKYSQKAKGLRRAKELEGDFAPFLDILEYDMEHSQHDVFLQTHATNPLLRTATIDKALDLFFSESTYDSLFGASRVRSRIYDEGIRGVNHKPGDRLLRTQDLPQWWEENSTMYVFSRESWQAGGRHRLGARPLAFEVPDLEAHDIDEEQDFIVAKLLHKALQEGQIHVT